MGYTGCDNLEEMRNRTNFVKLTGAGMKESHAHDVTITKEPAELPRVIHMDEQDIQDYDLVFQDISG